MPGKVRVIPANTNEPMKHVVIYTRVSSNSMEQLDSLKAQISGLTKFVSGQRNWKLVDIHIDIASSSRGGRVNAFPCGAVCALFHRERASRCGVGCKITRDVGVVRHTREVEYHGAAIVQDVGVGTAGGAPFSVFP